jgi:hypothetical protein
MSRPHNEKCMKTVAATQVDLMKDYNPLHIICFFTILEIAEKNRAEFV